MQQINYQLTPLNKGEQEVLKDAKALREDGWKNIRIVQRPDENGEEKACKLCAGKGSLLHESCRRCQGTGKVKCKTVIRMEGELDLESMEGYKIQRTIELIETGCGMTNTGRAIIICGLKGEKLKPIYKRNVCDGQHAIFYVHAALKVCYCHHRGGGNGSVYFVATNSEPIEIFRWINTKDPERVFIDGFTSIEFPLEAAIAAENKSRCYHCRKAHYAESL